MEDFGRFVKKMFAVFVIFLTVLVEQGYGSNRCQRKAYIELYNKQNPAKFKCWPPPECHNGQEATVEPGSSHPFGTDISCRSCKNGFFSNNQTIYKCRKCTSCGKKQELYPCTFVKDRECANKCISDKYYFNSTEKECYPCVECCEGDDENIEPQCITMRKGIVIGGKGEKHCRLSNRRCDELPSTSPDRCTCNCSVPNNLRVAIGDFPTWNMSSNLHNNSSSLHKPCVVEMSFIIGLSCSLVVVLLLILGYFFYWRRTCPTFCISDSSTCAGSGCYEEVMQLTQQCMPCQEKLSLIPEVRIDEIPYDVEEILTEKLDANKPKAKNWWAVGRKIGILRSKLENVEQGGYPTKTIIDILSTWSDVPSIRQFVEIVHKLGRHDICNAVVEFYQNSTPETAV
ncbi:uncharacterized protein LOC111332925 isoform X1 [Stylophora pistillata]|uniref:TNFR-Cys domain-containing protein n=1 Tax=Stylophora pistillata TaxID=50429 RepID=A0A2B4S348_STYPI|nr:uncharacterized protein LOC111332925 isoform X1 [Stylophora pistillata]PFX23459.1 hypothetical protein AWC38_SpisGene12019 [Stylophora pistillata]